MKFTRRTFLTGVAAAGGGAILSNASRFDDTTNLIITALPVGIKNLPSAFVGFKIALLADFHVGVNIPQDFIAQALSTTLQEHPDLVVYGGDYVAINDSLVSAALETSRNQEIARLPATSRIDAIYNQLDRLFPKASPIPHVAVLGNHDHWVAPTTTIRLLTEHRIQPLVNESVVITRGEQSLRVIGVDDYWNGVPHLPRDISASCPRNEVRVLASHNPDFVATLQARTSFEFHLALCGHTHGGQIRPFGYAPFLNIQHRALGRGLTENITNSIGWSSRVYTSSGLGVVEIPLRINCPPEISILTLVSA